jgi:hypothetical protein
MVAHTTSSNIGVEVDIDSTHEVFEGMSMR